MTRCVQGLSSLPADGTQRKLFTVETAQTQLRYLAETKRKPSAITQMWKKAETTTITTNGEEPDH